MLASIEYALHVVTGLTYVMYFFSKCSFVPFCYPMVVNDLFHVVPFFLSVECVPVLAASYFLVVSIFVFITPPPLVCLTQPTVAEWYFGYWLPVIALGLALVCGVEWAAPAIAPATTRKGGVVYCMYALVFYLTALTDLPLFIHAAPSPYYPLLLLLYLYRKKDALQEAESLLVAVVSVPVLAFTIYQFVQSTATILKLGEAVIVQAGTCGLAQAITPEARMLNVAVYLLDGTTLLLGLGIAFTEWRRNLA